MNLARGPWATTRKDMAGGERDKRRRRRSKVEAALRGRSGDGEARTEEAVSLRCRRGRPGWWRELGGGARGGGAPHGRRRENEKSGRTRARGSE